MTRKILSRAPVARIAIPLLVFVIFSAIMTGINMNRVSYQRGDTAVYLQLAENIANRGQPVSQLESSVLKFIYGGYLEMNAEQMRRDKLSPAEPPEYNELRGHEYLVMFPVALLTKIAPTDLVLTVVNVVCFMGLALLAFFFARSRGIPVIVACLFCLLVVSLPEWVDGLSYGQFYPDRVFLVAGFGLMMVASRERQNPVLLVACAIACAIVHERAATVAGVFLLSYLMLYWKEIRSGRLLMACLAVVLLAYGYIAVNFIVDRTFYSTYFWERQRRHAWEVPSCLVRSGPDPVSRD